MKTLYLTLKYGAILLWSSFVTLPFLWALTTSFKTANGVTGGATYIPWLQYEPSLEGWKVLVRSGGRGIDIVQPYISSIIVTLSASLISLVLGTLAAYGLARFTYKIGFVKNSDITFFFISQRIMPPIVLSITFFLMLQFLGLLDSIPGLILVYVALLLPIATWVMVDFFSNVPKEMDEMAMIDGCTPVGAFLSFYPHLHQNAAASGSSGRAQLFRDALVEPLGFGPGFRRAIGDYRFRCRTLSFQRQPGGRYPLRRMLTCRC